MIITVPNELLRQKSASVSPEEIKSGEIGKLIAEMRKTLKEAGGIGLAAVQIGVPKRVILVEVDERVHAFINAEIAKKSWKKIAVDEGCLSVPGMNGFVKRSETLKINALDQEGKEVELETKGLASIIFQHEIDHTNGILFIDKIWKK